MTDNIESGPERRRWPRRTVLWPAALQVGDDRHKCWIRNISASGTALQADVVLTKQLPVTVHLEKQGALEGFVIWTGTSLHGIVFIEAPEKIVQRFGDDAEKLGLV
jgi:hypothetical protein